MANYHLDSVTISSSLLVQEISIKDSTSFLQYFLVLSLFVFFDTLEHASHKPEVKVRVLHDVHELDMLKDISFLLIKLTSEIIRFTYCFTEIVIILFEKFI